MLRTLQLAIILTLVTDLFNVTESGLLRAQRHRWETDTETLYADRYSNCDYGYYALLPEGLIGHRGKAPSSNHGIRINLQSPLSTEPIPDSVDRYIFIYNFINPDMTSLDGIVQGQRTALKTIHGGAIVSEPASTSLGGMPAREYRSSFREAGVDLIEKDVVASRPGAKIVYHLSLLTTLTTSTDDEKLFDTIVEGFRLTKFPQGSCSND